MFLNWSAKIASVKKRAFLQISINMRLACGELVEPMAHAKVKRRPLGTQSTK